MKTVLRMLLAMVLLAMAVPARAGMSELVVETAAGARHPFSVEVADDDRSRAMGLMFRVKLGADEGMLFDFRPPQRVAMWMKNTFIPLDMLFLADDGRIVHVVARAVPHSLTHVGPSEPVRAVLEINGGTAERLGIATGDRVRHPIFKGG